MVPEAGSAIAPSNSSPVVLNCMIASQVQRIIGAPYALPVPLGMARRFELPFGRSAPLVAAFDEWMRAERAELSRHNAVAKAIDYLLTR